MTMADLRPPLSVVIGSTQPWPEIRGCLDSLYAQACEVGAEIIVADGTGRCLPDGDLLYPRVRRLKAVGQTVYQLRALAMAESSSEIVAALEDHCRVAPDWCAQVLRAHREFPGAAVIGGAVENGATDRLLDWAMFLITNGSFLLPIPIGERDNVSSTCISYKRRVLPSEYPAIGMVEAHYKETLRARGEKFFNDDAIVVEHVQSLGFVGSCLIHYHDGRCAAGFNLPRISYGARLLRILKGLALPLRVLFWTARLTLRIAVRKPRHRRRAVVAAPLVALLYCFHLAGELAGTIAGPGRSPSRLR